MSAKPSSDINKPLDVVFYLGGCCVNDSRVQMGEINALGPHTPDPH